MAGSAESLVFLPVSIDYYMEEGGGGRGRGQAAPSPVVQIIGKTGEGDSVLCRVGGFLPYFYALPPRSEPLSGEEWHSLLGDVFASERISYRSCEPTEKKSVYGYVRDPSAFLKIMFTNPKQLAAAKGLLEGGFVAGGRKVKMQVFESHVGFVLRFMVDLGITGMGYVRVRGAKLLEKSSAVDVEIACGFEDIESLGVEGRLPPLKIHCFDIECAGREGRFPNAKVDAVIQIGNTVCTHPSQEMKHRALFCLRACNPIAGVEVHAYETEAEMLSAWSDFVKREDPDIFTGYNIVNFDFPYLLDRAKHLGLEQFPLFSRTSSPVTARDSFSNNKAIGPREGKRIKAEGRLVFDMHDFIRTEFRLRSYSLNSVSAYFLKEQKEDVHFSMIPALQEGSNESRRRLGMYCMKDTYLPLKLLFVTNALMNYCEMARVTGVPFDYLVSRGQSIKVLSQLLRRARAQGYVLPTIDVGSRDETYEGGYVMEPMRGFYADPIVVLDFSSLYPSIMMAYNICYTTLLGPREVAKYRPEQYTRTPTGDCFVTKEVREGILPGILKDLIDARKHTRELLAAEKDPEMKKSLDGRQLALKISANSVYGFTGAAGSKLQCIPISQSVTSFGREILCSTKKEIEEEFVAGKGGKKITVIYGDTDSVMVDPKAGIEEAFRLGGEISRFVTAKLPRPLTLAFEKVYSPFLLMNKKRYAGMTHTAPGKEGRIDTKGIETVRRDNCELVREVMETSLDMILRKKDVGGAKAYVKGVVSDLLQNKIGMSQLVISKSLTKKGEAYLARQAHVELAERMRKRDPGSAPMIGDRVPYVIVRRGKGKGSAFYERSEDPVYVLEHNLPIDTSYYLEHQLKKPLQRLFEPIVENIDELLEGDHTKKIGRAGPMKSGLGGFFARKDVCVGCKVAGPVVCKSCEKDFVRHLRGAAEELSLCQHKYSRLFAECQRTQDSMHTPIVCCSRDCPVFYMRMEVKKELAEQQARYEKLYSFQHSLKPGPKSRRPHPASGAGARPNSE